jgi:hypothetical protein
VSEDHWPGPSDAHANPVEARICPAFRPVRSLSLELDEPESAMYRDLHVQKASGPIPQSSTVQYTTGMYYVEG